MKKNILIYCSAIMMLCSSCSDFLDTYPYDSLSPATTWKTESDAEKFLIGCYDGWIWGEGFFYWDCASDIGFSYHTHEGWRVIGNGTLTASNPGSSSYSYKIIRRCLTLLDNIDQITFADEKKKKDIIAQAKVILAYDYFKMNYWYGGVPIISSFKDAEEAKVPRNTEEEVKKYIYDQIDAAIVDINDSPAARGRVAKGAALALKMRSALYWGDYQRSMDAAKAIRDLGLYELDPDYANMFTLAGVDSKEIILSVQHLKNLKNEWIVTVANNADGGWSSMVPTQNLVDMYEMQDGLTKEESSAYDPTHPFKGRDPRMAMTVLYPGCEWQGGVFNTLDEALPNGSKNPNYPAAADNASKTALTWSKYVAPLDQYGGDLYSTSTSQIVFRYAEVLLTIAETSNELSGPSSEVYDALDVVRQRAGMPNVDRVKYDSKETLRELIRRERSIELAGEGHRRADLMRWKDASGKMLAETILNAPLTRVVGTVNYNEPDPDARATVNVSEQATVGKIEDRKFAAYNRYLPLPQAAMDKNPKLEQNPGY
ncbi:MAG: RagB/SusD family nutrient uptake outer membrane protein [Tannerellaceae bacterium]|nr:RagB/SusD family nutrient uptake outer membrane protein [Tannerellaceae bacterium]